MFATKSHAVAEAMDRINDKYGEFVITPALMMGMRETILDRIAFGGVKELEELLMGVLIIGDTYISRDYLEHGFAGRWGCHL
jgi:hypothetical protein